MLVYILPTKIRISTLSAAERVTSAQKKNGNQYLLVTLVESIRPCHLSSGLNYTYKKTLRKTTVTFSAGGLSATVKNERHYQY